MKIHISVEVPSVAQTRASCKPAPSLEDRVDYAIDQIIARTSSRQRAVEFCREAFDYLDAVAHPSEKQQALKERLKPVINEFGKYHAGSSQKENK